MVENICPEKKQEFKNVCLARTSANSLNCHLYLLEGLNRWNQDRQTASLAGNPSSLLSYSGDLVHCANTMSLKVLGRKVVPSFQPPAVYTGELTGIRLPVPSDRKAPAGCTSPTTQEGDPPRNG
ncbi:unnamed protein product [Pleuronectes platessa]|uniref:Uncharacterized protein n=1 Tax=Pleuronectes platessa TaxID=8262 RepID=A0A9N7V267_PLEPL|nr:unnamed protein product [Pleuronectes platessa]